MECVICKNPVPDGGFFIAVELLPARERKQGAAHAKCLKLPAELTPVPDPSAKLIEDAQKAAAAAAEKVAKKRGKK